MPTTAPASFSKLLHDAVNEPGKLSESYRAFHGFSISNRLLAWTQCEQRGLKPGPLATFNRWREKFGRHVRRGEKALVLCRPMTVKRGSTGDENDDGTSFTRFVYRPMWFVLAQTEGQPFSEPPTPEWDKDLALAALDISEIPFDALDGNCLGFARGRGIAINPVNPLPFKTRFHECAHVLLGHTANDIEQRDGDTMPRKERELEAEGVALLCCAALNLPGADFSRGYIQSWWGVGNRISERCAQRILKTADQILKAGYSQSV